MERIRMVGNFELVYEKDIKMYRVVKVGSEKFSKWYNSEEAEKLKNLSDDDFFSTAEKAIQDAENIR